MVYGCIRWYTVVYGGIQQMHSSFAIFHMMGCPFISHIIVELVSCVLLTMISRKNRPTDGPGANHLRGK